MKLLQNKTYNSLNFSRQDICFKASIKRIRVLSELALPKRTNYLKKLSTTAFDENLNLIPIQNDLPRFPCFHEIKGLLEVAGVEAVGYHGGNI